jgi:hypothetical protein
MPSELYFEDDRPYHEDLMLEREHERYELARSRITVSDVLATFHDRVQSEPDMRKDPVYPLAKHVLHHGGYRSSGQHFHMVELLAAKLEDLLEDAIERLVQEELESGVSWED